MNFEFITDSSTVTEIEVLCCIYNLMITYFIYDICKVGFKYVTAFLKKGVWF